jgi:lysophospholipase L1-like esterase
MGNGQAGMEEWRHYSFLALGDSYTVGEGVARKESFPFQTSGLLHAAGHSFSDPVLLAKTGWTTGELMKALEAATTGFNPPYDVVSLLIGVNDEYRGLSQNQYEREFRALLESAVRLAGSRPQRTFVLSIPDWSVTPFAAIHLPDALGRDRQTISREIDLFNNLAARHAADCAVEFIDITSHSRKAGDTPFDGSLSGSSWFATDGLHPSGRQYRHWAEQLAGRIQRRLAEPGQGPAQ